MRRRSKPTQLALGTYSEGTLRPEDLIDAVLPAIEALRLSRADRTTVRELRAEYDREINRTGDDSEVCDGALDDIWQDVCQLAETLVPDYCTFGSTEGDGALIGVWPSLPDVYDEDVYRADEGPSTAICTDARHSSRCPATCPACRLECTQRGYWLHVNDHGNATLYARVGKTWARYREVWSVV